MFRKLLQLFLTTQIVFICYSYEETNNETPSQKLNRTIEDLKLILKNGLPVLNIPPKDPLIIKDVSLIFSNNLIDSNVILNSIYLDKFTDFYANKLEVKHLPKSLNVEFVFLNTTLSFNYDGEINFLDMLSLYGHGIVKANLIGFRLGANIFITVSEGKHVKISKLTFSLFLKDFKFEITGLQENEEISKSFSEDFSDILPKFLHSKEAWLNEKFSGYLTELLNSQIKNLPLDEIISIFDQVNLEAYPGLIG